MSKDLIVNIIVAMKKIEEEKERTKLSYVKNKLRFCFS